MTQERFAKLIGGSITKVYRMEQREQDTTTIGQIRVCYEYARKHGIKWPRGLLMAMLEQD